MLRELYGSFVRQPRVRAVVTTAPAIRRLAWRFVAGETLDDGLAAIRTLNDRGIAGILNHVGTHVRDEAGALASVEAAMAALGRIRRDELDAHLSLKLTQIGLDIDEAFCRDQLRRVLSAARHAGSFVRIDMEESAYVGKTIGMFEEAREEFGTETVGIAIQSYLRNRAGDLERVLAGGSRVRLVKGGYWESPEVAYRSKADIDRCFSRDIELALTRGRNPAVATHDARCIALTDALAAKAAIGREGFEFEMLFGVRPRLRDRLLREGFKVRCYVPYGEQWYGYFLGCVRRVPGGLLRRLGEWMQREPGFSSRARTGAST